jgi:hypothetical protein
MLPGARDLSLSQNVRIGLVVYRTCCLVGAVDEMAGDKPELAPTGSV